MPGFSSIDDFVTEVTTNGKFWRQEFVKSTGGTVQAVGRWYDFWVMAGNPPAALYSGTTKTFVACDSTPVRITSGTATAASAVITTSNTSGLAIGMLVSGSAGTVTIPANVYITAISTNTSFTISSVTGGSSTGTPDVTCAFPTIWHGGNVSADLKSLVNFGAYYYAAAFGPNILSLVDVLGYYPINTTDLNSTTQRVLNNTITLPRYTTGAGVRAYFVTTVAPTAGGPNLTEFTYTNQAGVTGRTCPVAPSFGATPIVGHLPTSDTGALKFQFLPLAAGDSGIRSVQSFTCSGGTAYTGSGAAALVLCKPITSLPITVNGVASERNLMMQCPSLPQIVDGACLNLLNFASAATTANTNVYGYLEAAWG
jgi:hypothetical protein